MYYFSVQRTRLSILLPGLSVGGSTVLVCELAKRFSEDPSFEVELVVFFDGIPDKYSWIQECSHLKIVFLHKTKHLDFAFQKRLKNEISLFKPDIIWTHLTAPAHLRFALGRRAFDCPVIHTIHSVPSKDWPLPYQILLKKRVQKGDVKLVGVSRRIAERAASLYGINQNQVVSIANGISLPKPSAKGSNPDKQYDFLCVGRFSECKNFPDLIKAFSLLSPKENNLSLCLCGYGELESDIKQQIKDLGLESCVALFGKDQDVSILYQKSKVFCLFSSFEGNPITILEAKSYGLPIIATKVGGIPEVIQNGENGILIENAGNIALESAAMNELLQNEKLRRRMSQKSLESSQLYSIDATYEQYRNLFEKSIKERRA